MRHGNTGEISMNQELNLYGIDDYIANKVLTL